MTSPKVTVLMAVYNADAYLPSAIDSVLNQTLPDFELRIAYTASKDGSLETIEQYQDARIRVVPVEAPGNISAARNRALSTAEGEYVAVLDADDMAHPDRLRAQAAFLDQHPEATAVTAAYEIINERGTVLSYQPVPHDSLSIRWGLLFGNNVGHSATMYRRNDAVAVGGYDDHVLAGEDYDLWVRLLSKGEIAPLSQPLMQWRRHERSLQLTEPAHVKEHLVWTVVRSIWRQTSLEISYSVAATLHRNRPQPAPNKESLQQAFVAIENCWRCFAARKPAAALQSEHVAALAIHDLFRLARQNPGAYVEAWRRAATLAMQHAHYRPTLAQFARSAGFSLLPARWPESIRRNKQRWSRVRSRTIRLR